MLANSAKAAWSRRNYRNDQKHLDSVVKRLRLALVQTNEYVGIETDFNSTYLFFYWQGSRIRRPRYRRMLGKVRRKFATQAVNRILQVLAAHRAAAAERKLETARAAWEAIKPLIGDSTFNRKGPLATTLGKQPPAKASGF